MTKSNEPSEKLTTNPQNREQEKLSRRAVLAKVGIRFGTGVLFSLAVDDLARIVTKEIAIRTGHNQVAQAVADEFQKVGVAFATPGITSCDGCWSHCFSAGYFCDPCPAVCGNRKTLIPKVCSTYKVKANCTACCDEQYEQCWKFEGRPKANCRTEFNSCQATC